jgi:hypothetical protein
MIRLAARLFSFAPLHFLLTTTHREGSLPQVAPNAGGPPSPPPDSLITYQALNNSLRTSTP